ncbi:MAG: zinc-ribbon domain-containing protein, partial [Gemmataceae bacterium]|nr:zinc-ribbon domain-containing protein [Gemmataceae bacterium]
MPALITCPQCGLQGDLPDEQVGALIGCPRCRAEFTAQPSAPTAATDPPDPAAGRVRDDLAVWVGKGPPPAAAAA